jgi:hypothetical protein
MCSNQFRYQLIWQIIGENVVDKCTTQKRASSYKMTLAKSNNSYEAGFEFFLLSTFTVVDKLFLFMPKTSMFSLTIAYLQ